MLLADFANNTGDPVFDLTLREALAVQLSQSPFLAIVPEERVRETLRMMQRPADERLSHALAREVCERTGAKAMLEGQLAVIGSSYLATLEAIGCSGGESLAREQAQVDSKEKVLRALGPIASSMRAQLGESLATVRKFDVPIEQATTRSLEALKSYALGVAQRAKGDDIGAIPFLEHAVELDSSFASAHSALSAIFGGLGEPAERASHARLAYDNRSHVTERERLFIEYQHYDATGDERRASEILEIWKQLYPRDYRAPNALALAFNRFGQYERAIEEALEAQRRNPEHPFPRSNLAYAYRGANRFAEARRTAEQAIALKTETVPLRRLLYQLAVMDGDLGLADATLEWGKGRAREFDLIGAEAQAVAFSGQLARARPLYEKTTEMARRQGLVQVGLGYAAQAAWTEALYGNREAAAQQARAVLRADPSAAPRLRAVAALALAGAPDEAEPAIAAPEAERGGRPVRVQGPRAGGASGGAPRAPGSRRRRSRRCCRRSRTSVVRSRCSRPRSCAGSPACGRATPPRRARTSRPYSTTAASIPSLRSTRSPGSSWRGLARGQATPPAAGLRTTLFSRAGRRPTRTCRSSSRRARSERLCARRAVGARRAAGARPGAGIRAKRLEQLGGSRLRRPELPDHHRGGCVRERRRLDERGARRRARARRWRSRCRRRPSRRTPRGRRRGRGSGRPAALEEAHAVLAARHQHRAAAEQREDPAPGRGELGGPREPQPRHLLRLELVRRHDASRRDRAGSGAASDPPAPARAARRASGRMPPQQPGA